MSVKQLYFKYQLAEAHGHIPQGTAAALTICTIQEAGIQAFHQAYYGNAIFGKVLTERQANHEAGEIIGNVQESLLGDVRPLYRVFEATHTTSDFPLVLANIRDRVQRKVYSPTDSQLFAIATERDVTDFKPVKGIRYNTIDRLKIRPEGTDVTEVKLTQTEDGYVVANYEKALSYTWEAWVNDDLSIFTNGMAELGNAAKRNRILVVLEAINAGLTAKAYGGAGGPTNARLKAVIKDIAATKNADNNVIGFRATDLLLPVQWEEDAVEALTSDTIQVNTGDPTKNTIKGRLSMHIEKLMGRVLGDDFIVYDGDVKWLEIAYLTGFRAGPKTYTKAPDTVEHLDEGSFKNHDFKVKVGDVVGSKVVETQGVQRVDGS